MTLKVTGLESSETQDDSEESGETVPCKKLDLKSKELLGKHGRQGNKLCLFFFFFSSFKIIYPTIPFSLSYLISRMQTLGQGKALCQVALFLNLFMELRLPESLMAMRMDTRIRKTCV